MKMKPLKSVVVIGYGNMGGALVDGMVNSRRAQGVPPVHIHVVEKGEARRAALMNAHGARSVSLTLNGHNLECLSIYDDGDVAADGDIATADGTADGGGDGDVAAEPDLVILAVKPQDIPAVTKAYGGLLRNMPVISIAAGIAIAQLQSLMPSSPIIRFMPSLAARVGKSVTAVSCSPDCSAECRSHALEVAGSIGLVLEIRESLIPAIIGVSGSAIAYVYEFIHALTLGGIREGLGQEQSLNAVLNTMEGAVATVRQAQTQGQSPPELITQVCSPGGTTIEGIRSLHSNHFTATVMDAVRAAAERSRSLEKPSA